MLYLKFIYICKMSLRKWTIISILFLAGITMLMHEILPHFYHDNTICLAIKHAGHCGLDDNGQTHDNNHKENHCHECPFSNTFVSKTYDGSLNIIKMPVITMTHICGIMPCHIFEYFTDGFTENKPYLELYFTQYVVPTLGLRAPPRVSFLG